MSGIGWELGYEDDADFGIAMDVGGMNREDIDAINEYFGRMIRQVENDRVAGRVSDSVYRQWVDKKNDWMTFYQRVIDDWWVSDEDAAFARKKRDDVNRLLQPEATAFVEKHTVQKKLAMTPEEFRATQEEGKAWWERHWKAIGLTAAGIVVTTYLTLPRLAASVVRAAKS